MDAFFIIQHADPAMLDRFQKGFAAFRLYEEFKPCPIPEPGKPNAPRGATLKRQAWCEENWGTGLDLGPWSDTVVRRAGKFRIEMEVSDFWDRARFLDFLKAFGFVISWEPLLDDPDKFQPDRGTVRP